MPFQRDAPHPAHHTFGDAVSCSYRHFETGRLLAEHGGASSGIKPRIKTGMTMPRSFDVILAEGMSALQTVLVYGTIRNPSATVIDLGVNGTFYRLRERSNYHL